MTDESPHKKRRLPPWLVGLILGAILTATALFVLERMGYGDEPAIGDSIGPPAYSMAPPAG